MDDCDCGHESDETTKKTLIVRLKKIEGQLKGIVRMVEEDTYCDHILHQFAAVQSALASASRVLLENHVRTCVVDRLKKNDTTIVDELMKTLKALEKS